MEDGVLEGNSQGASFNKLDFTAVAEMFLPSVDAFFLSHRGNVWGTGAVSRGGMDLK